MSNSKPTIHTENLYLRPTKMQVIGNLPDGTPLYQAFRPYALPGERERRSLSWWNGAEGETVGVTENGSLFRRVRFWSNRSRGWEAFRL